MRFTGLLPSVSCLVPVTRGNGAGMNDQIKAVTTKRAANAAVAHVQTRFLVRADTMAGLAALNFPEVVSRFRRFRSERISAAL